MASTGARSQELFAAVEEFTRVHNEWVNDPNTEYPTVAYWDSLDDMLAVFDNADIPADCRRLAAAVYGLQAEKSIHEATENVEPHHAFWAQREALENLWTTVRYGAKPKYRETVKELDRQGVPHEQIARIWGLRHRDGSGNSALIARELEFPGSVIGTDYVHPEDREEDAAAQRVIDRHRSDTPAQAAVAPRRAPGEDPPCPESSEELWLQKVPLPQASKMLKRPQDDVAREWKTFEQGRIARQEAKAETTQERVPPVAPVATAAKAKTAAAEPADTDLEDVDDPYMAFADWSDDEVKTHAKTLGLTFPAGRWSRIKTLERILVAEAQGEAEADKPAEVSAPEEVSTP